MWFPCLTSLGVLFIPQSLAAEIVVQFTPEEHPKQTHLSLKKVYTAVELDEIICKKFCSALEQLVALRPVIPAAWSHP